MGALHEGHARLIERARGESGLVVTTIFVNPLQFDRKDDLEKYPGPLDADMEVCRRLGVDLVFAPPVEEMYPQPLACVIEVKRIANHLCGAFRPGHFAGVATVVMKLFQIVGADKAFFGEKDAQQLAIVRRMVKDFNVPIEIVGVATVREPDGLALSSRNQRLSEAERKQAVALYRALQEAERQIAAGVTDSTEILRLARAVIPPDPALRLEYLEIVEPDEMQPVATVAGAVIVAGAMWVGSTRLIDNVKVQRTGE